MPLAANALFTDPDEVWDALCVEEEDRVGKASMMERWINGTSAFLEALMNRPLIPKTFVDLLDGNRRPIMTLKHTPATTLISLRVYQSTFDNFDDIKVDQNPLDSPEVAFDGPRGRLVLLPDAPIARFTLGIENVHATYTVGFGVGEVSVFQEAAIELISARYADLGRNPLEIIRSDAINTLATYNRGNFEDLPFNVRQALEVYRKRSV